MPPYTTDRIVQILPTGNSEDLKALLDIFEEMATKHDIRRIVVNVSGDPIVLTHEIFDATAKVWREKITLDDPTNPLIDFSANVNKARAKLFRSIEREREVINAIIKHTFPGLTKILAEDVG